MGYWSGNLSVNTVMTIIAKLKNASPKTGSRCRYVLARPLFRALLIACLAGVAVQAQAASQGFNDPTANAARSGPAVITPDNAHVSNDAYAEFLDTAEHDYKTYTFTIPAGATIDGVEVRAEWHTTKDSDTGFLTVQLLDNLGNQVGASGSCVMTPCRPSPAPLP